MKNVKNYVICLGLLFSVLAGCQVDPTTALFPHPTDIQSITGNNVTDRYKTLKLFSGLPVANGRWEWKVNGKVVSTDSVYYFISDQEGPHEVTLSLTRGGNTTSSKTTVQVNKETTAYTAGVTRVFDYFPAPGQFVHNIPSWEEGDDEARMISKAESSIKSGNIIHLGSFGGYATFGFDHAIMNVPGQYNFKVLGNAFNQWSEAAIIEVAIDANHNGLPDDEWFEIAGSEYKNSKTIRDYEVTYYKPDENKAPVTDDEHPYNTDLEYIKWTDNKGGSGYVFKNSFYSQSYYPQWKGATITFKGTKLTNDLVRDISGSGSYWISEPFEFGYADNWPNANEQAGIKIDWAVNKKTGKPVKLSGIHFVRVYTGLLADAGWLGEISSEIAGVEDLNLK